MATAKKAKPAAAPAAAGKAAPAPAAAAKKKAPSAPAAAAKAPRAAAAAAAAAPAAAMPAAVEAPAKKGQKRAAAPAKATATTPKAPAAAAAAAPAKKQRTTKATKATPAVAAAAAAAADAPTTSAAAPTTKATKTKPRARKASSASADVRAALLASRHLRPPQRAEAASKAGELLPGVERARVERACASLIRFSGDKAEREAGAALPMGDDVADEALQLLVALKRVPEQAGKRKDKPVQLDVPHPMWTLNHLRGSGGAGGSGGGGGAASSSAAAAAAAAPPPAQICLFVRDDNKGSGHRAAKLRLSKIEGGAGVAKVIGTSKLRGKYESHEARRKLCASYDLFLADDRVLPSLPKLLGKQFFRRRKQPIPVRLSGGSGAGWRDLPAAVKRAAASAVLLPPRGTTVVVRCARVAHGAQGCADNVLAALAGVVARVPRGWANVAAAYVKTSDSVALPLYQSAAEAPDAAEAARAAVLAAKRGQRKGQRGRGAGAAAGPAAAAVDSE